MKKYIVVFGALVLLLGFRTAAAVSLSLEPANSIVNPGDSVSLDLTISGLGSGMAPSLGDFDILIGFDPGALSFTGGSLGPFLGDLALFDAIGDVLDLGGGLISADEVSFLPPADLDLLQTGSFALATLMFDVDVLSPGSTTTISFNTINALGDGFGMPLTIDGTNPAVLQAPGQSIPEPVSLALLAIGMLGIKYARQRTL